MEVGEEDLEEVGRRGGKGLAKSSSIVLPRHPSSFSKHLGSSGDQTKGRGFARANLQELPCHL
jgi:hypothetical protein